LFAQRIKKKTWGLPKQAPTSKEAHILKHACTDDDCNEPMITNGKFTPPPEAPSCVREMASTFAKKESSQTQDFCHLVTS